MEVAVEAGDHQQLFQRLRTLWQCIELTRIHPRGYDEVACAFRSRTDEDRCLHLYELLCVKEVADEDGHAVTQLQVLADRLAAEIQIAVFHAEVVAAVRIVFYRERRCQGWAEHFQLFGDDFDVTCRNLAVLALPFADSPLHLNAVFASQLVGFSTECGVICLIENQLRNAIAVAEVKESHASHFT